MTDSPPQKSTRSKVGPRKKGQRQTALPLLDVTPPPAVPPTAPPPALADRAARYNRHRSALDDRPLAEQVTQPPAPPRSAAPARTYAYQRAPEPARQDAIQDDPRPKVLDMAALAARNRLARDAAREERPVAHPTPIPSARQRLERPVQAVPKPDAPKPNDESMLARAARHNTLLRDEEERASALAQKPVEVKAPVTPRTKPQPDDQSMVERAADATKRRRQALGGALPAGTPEESLTPSLHLATTAGVLVSRNDAGRVADRLTAWRALVEAPDVRWWLLDLGSVDESIAHAEALHASVIVVPGGAVEPMATLAQLLRRVDADTVLIADADALPDRRSLRVLTDVRNGKSVAAAPTDSPGVLAIDRKAWLREGFGDAIDLTRWSQQPLPGHTPLLRATGSFVPRLLHAPESARIAAKALPWLRRVRRLLRK